ncbi:hypothetical protein [Ancylobacter polymorphus]|uniref:Uncharacterized protein n=1 Tax=Ancylobacter polymorphus TaxID=223390 RepID=A0ABU0BDA2_9HYPH|nr:hypothetical protein [Ancylobacter polymorphus]MDQ0303786.1 hypothetical protein [Ancylobacter polymorphus]
MTEAPTVLDEDLRLAGFTEAARQFPRSDAAFAAICAWNNVSPANAPAAWRYFPNAATRDAWERVVSALIAKEESNA